MKKTGIVYLLHFARPLQGRAAHYIGSTTLDRLPERIAEHRAGKGSKLTAAAAAAGILMELVRTWTGPRRLERQLKSRHQQARLCPVCRAAALAVHAAQERAARRRRPSPATGRTQLQPKEVA